MCELTALRDGVAYVRKSNDHDSIDLHVFGDSQLIMKAMAGWVTLQAPHLQALNEDVHDGVAPLGQVSWQHVRREHNTAADFLANTAMDSKTSKTMSVANGQQPTGLESIRYNRLQDLARKDAAFELASHPRLPLIEAIMLGMKAVWLHRVPSMTLSTNVARTSVLFKALAYRSISQRLVGSHTKTIDRGAVHLDHHSHVHFDCTVWSGIVLERHFTASMQAQDGDPQQTSST